MKPNMYKRSDEAIFADVGSDVLALHVDRGQCYGMDQVAAQVWKLLVEPSTLDSICNDLIERYDVDPEVCRGDVARLLQQMQNEGLVEQVGAAA